MSSMFSYADAFNQDIGGWNVRKVTSMDSMFLGAKSFWQDVSAWTFDGFVNTYHMWLVSYLEHNSAACGESSRPSCTAGIQ